ncbi:MAG: RsmE family RNA methyltransferase [Chitinophagales bacterium]
MELFFSNRSAASQLFLDPDESRHCLRVMRHQVGDELMVTDGMGKLMRARLTGEIKKEAILEVIEIVRVESASFPQIHIAIASTKNMDRFEWFLEKASELGITEITPLICARSERDKIKPERLQKILSAAMKQSLRLWLPKLNEQSTFNSFLSAGEQVPGFPRKYEMQKFICHCRSENLPPLKSLNKPGENVLIMIGPEGDFTPEEIELAKARGFSEVTLGRNRLRTETAGIVAVHTVQLLNS